MKINGLGLSPGGRISKSIKKTKNNQRFRAKPLTKTKEHQWFRAKPAQGPD
jgi:hypothetical protein